MTDAEQAHRDRLLASRLSVKLQEVNALAHQMAVEGVRVEFFQGVECQHESGSHVVLGVRAARAIQPV